jgi:hypothetical protein
MQRELKEAIKTSKEELTEARKLMSMQGTVKSQQLTRNQNWRLMQEKERLMGAIKKKSRENIMEVGRRAKKG